MLGFSSGLRGAGVALVLCACGPQLGTSSGSDGETEGSAGESNEGGEASATESESEAEAEGGPGEATTEEPPAPDDDSSGGPGDCVWAAMPLIEDDGRSEAFDVSPWSGGVILGTAISDGDVLSIDGEGAIAWTYDVEPTAISANVLAVQATENGGAITAAQVLDDGGTRLVVHALSPDGEPEWRMDLGEMNGNAWARADIAVSDGDYLIAWDAGDVALARLDAGTGGLAWQVGSTSNAPVADWIGHALDVLPIGDSVQLLPSEHRLRIVHREPIEGALVSEAEVAGVDGITADLVALPDGTIFVLANHLEDGPRLLEIDLDGNVIATHEYDGGDDEFANAMAWDEITQTLYIAGTAREPSGTQRPWRVVVDREGAELFNERADGLELTAGLAAAALPTGGFVESRFHQLHVFEVSCSPI